MSQALILQRGDVLPELDLEPVWLPRYTVVAVVALLLIVACGMLFSMAPRGVPASQTVRLPLGITEDSRALSAARDIILDTGPEVSPDRAREINAAQPFSKAPLVPARAFRFLASGESHEKARDCLAAAQWYEAGDDPAGQRSVAQVVLNRTMHPAFPKTVCSVVFQGSERPTGCQFTFTCDGSMQRRVPSPSAWARARAIADSALGGAVDPAVGLATHYHTDWVAPRWSSAMLKIARVGTHLFFRFPGQLGRPDAYRDAPGGMEPKIMALAALSPAHWSAEAATTVLPTAVGADVPQLGLALPVKDNPREMMGTRVSASASGQFALQLNMEAAWGGYLKVARALCASNDRCTVMGWSPNDAPTVIQGLQARRATALFVYRKTLDGTEQALWDCRQFLRPDAQCMPGTRPQEPA